MNRIPFAAAAITLGLLGGGGSQAATCPEWRWLVAQAGSSFEGLQLTRTDDYVYNSSWAPSGWVDCQVVDSDDGMLTFGCSRQASGLPANEARAIVAEIVACVPGSTNGGWDSTWGDEIIFPNGTSLSIDATRRRGFVQIMVVTAS